MINNVFLYLIISMLFIIIIFSKKRNKHQNNILSSKKILLKLNCFKFEGQKINYLKKINPFVFEELLLSAFEEKGYKIKRNKKYTGDGGFDGTIFDKQNNKYLIQAKRYSYYINPKHITEFGELLKKNKCKGFFIHTGKTGRKSFIEISKYHNIEIISGNKLIKLISK